MTFLFFSAARVLGFGSHSIRFWLWNQWGLPSCKWEDFGLDFVFLCNLISLVETFRMQKNMWERKPLGSWSYLQIWLRLPLIKNLFYLLIVVAIYERNTDRVSWIPGGESFRSCTSLVSHLEVDHCKNQNCSLPGVWDPSGLLSEQCSLARLVTLLDFFWDKYFWFPRLCS